jgi:hypothetical protein
MAKTMLLALVLLAGCQGGRSDDVLCRVKQPQCSPGADCPSVTECWFDGAWEPQGYMPKLMQAR